MAVKSVFTCKREAPYFEKHNIEFKYNMGLSISQKRKNIRCVHNIFNEKIKPVPVLEISSKSEDELGIKLSAFNLHKYMPSLKKSVPVECIYQAAKVFEHGGPFTDLLYEPPKVAKKDERLKKYGCITNYAYEDKLFPCSPKWAFYNYLYLSALKENPHLAEHLTRFEAFSDIELAIDSVNCQAAAAAQFVSLSRENKLDAALSDFDTFLKICNEK